MRTLDFGQDLSLSAEGTLVVNNRPRLYSRIIAYLAFPECLERRYEFLVTCGAELLQREFSLDAVEQYVLHRDHESMDDAEALRKNLQQRLACLNLLLLKENFLDFGGGFGPAEAVASRRPLPESLNAGLWHATLAGYRLLFTAIMAVHHDNELRAGAGLGKATDLIVWLGRKSDLLKSRNPVMEAWQSHKNVAHLAAAAVCIGRKIYRSRLTANSVQVPTDFIVEHLEEFIRISQDFLDFGLFFKSPKWTQTIFDRDTVWRLPVRLASRPLEPDLPRLSAEQLEYLITKRWAPAPPE